MKTNLENMLDTIMVWMKGDGIAIIATIIVTLIFSKIIKHFITRIIRRLVLRKSFASEFAEKRREDTLIKIAQRTLGIFIWTGSFFVILEIIGIPLTPLLTGAGIIGVGIGFGSQSLVKDVITGLFIIAENQYRIGDVITIAGVTGTVEDITLRLTKIREINGSIHYVPNGEIKVTSNESMDYSVVDLTVDVSYQTNIDHVRKVVNEIGKKLAEEEEFKNDIIEAPYFLRVNDLADYSIKIRILSKVLPNKQYRIKGIIRERIKIAFEQEGIEIPYPTNTQYSRIEK